MRKNRGFTLVELMIVVAIIGILAALAIYGVKKYLTNAKTGEAKNNLGRLGKDAAAAYAREYMDGSVLSDADSTEAVHRLCGPASAAVPASIPGATKIQPAANAWVGTPLFGWKCLRFSIPDPVYYQYAYTSDASTADTSAAGTEFTATATGNLDGGDTDYSVWTYAGEVADGRVKLAPTIQEPDDPEE